MTCRRRQEQINSKSGGGFGPFFDLSTALILRFGGKLLCQLGGSFIYIGLNELGDFSEAVGLDTQSLLRGEARLYRHMI
jgi:hypothetical protein